MLEVAGVAGRALRSAAPRGARFAPAAPRRERGDYLIVARSTNNLICDVT